MEGRVGGRIGRGGRGGGRHSDPRQWYIELVERGLVGTNIDL